METLRTQDKKTLEGSRILRLLTLSPDTDAQPSGTRMSTQEIMSRLVLGDELANDDQLIIDGRDARELLPRPDAYGNNRLALMAALSGMPPGTEMNLKIETSASQSVAAD